MQLCICTKYIEKFYAIKDKCDCKISVLFNFGYFK